jgi:hypothetical protein
MKKTYLNPSCKLMVMKNEAIMATTVVGGGEGDMGWGGEGDGSGADANQINVWGEENE